MVVEDSIYFEELKTALEAAEEAGEIIDRYAREGFKTENKDDGSKVTDADLESQEKIVEIISEEFPEDGFLGEEEHLEPEGEERVWIIDPIDGTFNFDSGFPYYCVSIGLEVNGEIVLGVVHLPETSRSETYFAVRDEGTYRKAIGGEIDEAEQLQVSDKDEIKDSIFFLTTFDIYEGELEAELGLLEELTERDGVQRQLGACAVEMCFLASGKVDFMVDPIAKKVDYAGAKTIVEEAGGKIRVRDSKFSNSNEIVASNGEIQRGVEDLVGDSFQ